MNNLNRVMELLRSLLFTNDTHMMDLLAAELSRAPLKVLSDDILDSSDNVYGLYINSHSLYKELYGGLAPDTPVFIGAVPATKTLKTLKTILETHHYYIKIGTDGINEFNIMYRSLYVRDAWRDGYVAALIDHLQPLWNTVILNFPHGAWQKFHLEPELGTPQWTKTAQRIVTWCRERGFPSNVPNVVLPEPHPILRRLKLSDIHFQMEPYKCHQVGLLQKVKLPNTTLCAATLNGDDVAVRVICDVCIYIILLTCLYSCLSPKARADSARTGKSWRCSRSCVIQTLYPSSAPAWARTGPRPGPLFCG